METKGEHTLAEINSQPAVWAEVLQSYASMRATVEERWAVLNPANVLFIGCGSTHYLSQVAASLFQGLTGIPSQAYPSSEVVLFPAQTLPDPQRTLLVVISRSGTTTETLEAVKVFRNHGGLSVWAVSCYPQNDLALASDLALLAPAAQEQSVAQTRSFTSMLLLVEALVATIAGEGLAALDSLPAALGQLMDRANDLVASLGRRADLQRMFFLGSGYQYGIANEAMLKMKEMSLTDSEAFHFLEFRHGPMSMANEQALVVGLISEVVRPHEEAVLAEMNAFGAETLGLNSNSSSSCRYQLAIDSTLPAWTLPVLYLPPLQLMAFNRAVSKGLDPDNPRNLAAVVSLDPAVFGVT